MNRPFFRSRTRDASHRDGARSSEPLRPQPDDPRAKESAYLDEAALPQAEVFFYVPAGQEVRSVRVVPRKYVPDSLPSSETKRISFEKPMTAV